MKNKNHNIRFNMERGDECRAWELLHSPQIRQMFKSQNRFVIEAVNNYYDRCVAVKRDPYLETREKEDAFAERIVEMVEKKVMSNLPALFGMYMAQMQFFPLSVPMGAYPATQGIQTHLLIRQKPLISVCAASYSRSIQILWHSPVHHG